MDVRNCKVADCLGWSRTLYMGNSFVCKSIQQARTKRILSFDFLDYGGFTTNDNRGTRMAICLPSANRNKVA